MEHSVWMENLLEAIAQLGDEGHVAVVFLRRHYSYETPLDDLRVKTLIIHEARHLQQGMVTALSVYGELDAWQLEFGIYHRVQGQYPHPVIAELMTLPLKYDRGVLKKAAVLMQAYAGKGYRVDLLPLYPLDREIRYWAFRNKALSRTG